MRRSVYNVQTKNSSCHSLLYFFAMMVGLVCGGCGAEFAIRAINVVQGEGTIDEDAYPVAFGILMASMTVALGLGTYAYLEHRNVHATQMLSRHLNALKDKELYLDQRVKIDFSAAASCGDIVSMAKRCSTLVEQVSAEHQLKGRLVGVSRQFHQALVTEYHQPMEVPRSDAEIVGHMIVCVRDELSELLKALEKLSQASRQLAALNAPGCCTRFRLCCQSRPSLGVVVYDAHGASFSGAVVDNVSVDADKRPDTTRADMTASLLRSR